MRQKCLAMYHTIWVASVREKNKIVLSNQRCSRKGSYISVSYIRFGVLSEITPRSMILKSRRITPIPPRLDDICRAKNSVLYAQQSLQQIEKGKPDMKLLEENAE
jgi:hypothetical protein